MLLGNTRRLHYVDKMSKAEKLLTGDALIAAAFISYVGPFTKVSQRYSNGILTR